MNTSTEITRRELAEAIGKMADRLEAISAQLEDLELRTTVAQQVEPVRADLATVAQMDPGYEVDHAQYAWTHIAEAAEGCIEYLPLRPIDSAHMLRIARAARAEAGEDPATDDADFWADIENLRLAHHPGFMATAHAREVHTALGQCLPGPEDARVDA